MRPRQARSDVEYNSGCRGCTGALLENVFHSKTVALNTIVTERLAPEICRTCSRRIFRECAQMPGPETQ